MLSNGDRWPALSCVITFSHFITIIIIIIIIIIIVIISCYYYFFTFLCLIQLCSFILYFETFLPPERSFDLKVATGGSLLLMMSKAAQAK